MAKNKTLTVHVVLDRSGSMETIRDDTIGAFNAYVERLAKDAPKSRLSLTLFDSGSVDTVVDDQAIKDVVPLDRSTFVPRGMTPLYDAIGKVVAKLDAATGKHKALVILTDGQENNSREMTQDAAKALIADRQERQNWLVIYLGANQDAFAVGHGLGIAKDTTMNYAGDGKTLRASMASASRSTMTYASGNRLGAGFTDQERKDAMAK